ncbi:hypothetical protein, partial [Myxococcus sp. AB025B]|uniref:hypothetical protein n=1 Tax=Myxococcus sp. AB025B TaxID=2562794 RepID=UPI001891E556
DRSYPVRPQEPPRTVGIEKTTSHSKPLQHTLVFKETLALEALDCDSTGVPQRLLFTRTVGGYQPIVETRELFRVK